MQRTCHKTIVIHPHTGQFIINELPTLVLCGTVWVYGGMEGLPLTAIATVIALMLSLLLLYRYLYLRRIRYCIGTEQLVSEYGIIRRKVDYMELYRIVDFQEHQSLLQQFCGLKTVRILSMDRNTPRLDLIGIFHRDDLVSIIRERVETNKRKKGIYEIAASNPLEWTALAEGNELINGQIEKQIKGQTQTALLQNSIATEFNQIHKWEKQYNSYLKTASGYASSLKACTHLYNDGVRIFLTLGKLGKAIQNNPQGIVASMNMNNLYIETATELVSVFTLLNDAVAKGSNENMLTGSERSKTLWALNDQLSDFSRKLHLLYLSIRYYTFNDVWNNVTAGMLDRDNGEAARMALSHWHRAAALVR